MEKIECKLIDWQPNERVLRLEDGREITVSVYDGDEEACNIGTTDHVGYCIRGRLVEELDEYTPAGTRVNIVWDFSEMDAEEQPDALDGYDWYGESVDTKTTLEIWS